VFFPNVEIGFFLITVVSLPLSYQPVWLVRWDYGCKLRPRVLKTITERKSKEEKEKSERTKHTMIEKLLCSSFKLFNGN
jgi:hypothetical protein